MSRFAQAALALLAVMLAGPAQAMTYSECVALAAKRPAETFEAALAWADEGGGPAARHCAALALSAQGLHADAADRLEKLAEDMLRELPSRRAEILDQAGNAWLLAGETERAIAVFTTGMKLAPGAVDLYIDRARAFVAARDMDKARQDLDDALDVAPDRIEALVFRASARRQLGDVKGAREDVERALKFVPDNPEALLERGIVSRAEGNIPAARSDWLTIMRKIPESAVAEAARRQLEQMDVRKE